MSKITTFVYIVCGSDKLVLWAKESVRTLRAAGGWSGGVTIITDRKDSFVSCGADIVCVDKEQLPFELGAKIFKTRVLDLVTGCDACVFIDADILISGSVQPFIDSMNESKIFGLFKDQGGAAKQGRVYHSGILFLLRGKSERFLEAWRAEILEKKARWDQQALVAVAPQFDFHLFDDGMLLFPEKSSDFNGVVFAHYTHPRRKYIFDHAARFGIQSDREQLRRFV